MKFKKLIYSPVGLIPAQKLIKRLLIVLTVIGFGGTGVRASEKVEISGSYEVVVACYDTHHVELAQIVTPGKDKFSGVSHLLNLTEKQRANLSVGIKLKVMGQRMPSASKQISKRQTVPLDRKNTGEIISKLRTGKKAWVESGMIPNQLAITTSA